MCGIAGIVSFERTESERTVLRRMADTIRHRGPDNEGFFFAPHVGLAHRRLAIIDLTSGHQPMTSADGRYTIVFNGEIYNFLELRAALEKDGEVFTTKSDTEVLLRLFKREGPDCLQKLNGMFAFAVWDGERESLFIARDRMGKKPLYYARIGKDFIFASELKALLAYPRLARTIDKQSVRAYLTYEYIPAPLAIIQGVYKLPAGHCLRLTRNELQITRYWNLPFGESVGDDERTAAKKILELLDRAVTYRMIADVPLGVFLSGGIDSSSIVALMARHRAGRDIKTFSIHFSEASYNESLYSNEIAQKFGTDHHVETLSAAKMLDILPEVSRNLDEPFADGSILPTYLLAGFTRKDVTVALGGDGADELFAGYPTFTADRYARLYRRLPNGIKSVVRGLSRLLPVSDKNMSLDFKLRQFLGGADYPDLLRHQVWLSAATPAQQRDLLSKNLLAAAPNDPLDLVTQEAENCGSKNSHDQLLYFYQKFYLEGDILFKTDRASMAHSLEVRAPFLDVNVVEYATRLPFEFKLKGITTKFILKRACNRLLPAMITQRSKKGFGIPIAGWLKNELRPLLSDTLNRKAIVDEGLFCWPAVERMMAEHLAGRANHRKPLFALLMFQLWRAAHRL